MVEKETADSGLDVRTKKTTGMDLTTGAPDTDTIMGDQEAEEKEEEEAVTFDRGARNRPG